MSRHIRTITDSHPIEAQNPTLTLLLTFLAEVVGSFAVLQRQSQWKVPFPVFVFEPDDENENA